MLPVAGPPDQGGSLGPAMAERNEREALFRFPWRGFFRCRWITVPDNEAALYGERMQLPAHGCYRFSAWSRTGQVLLHASSNEEVSCQVSPWRGFFVAASDAIRCCLHGGGYPTVGPAHREGATEAPVQSLMLRVATRLRFIEPQLPLVDEPPRGKQRDVGGEPQNKQRPQRCTLGPPNC